MPQQRTTRPSDRIERSRVIEFLNALPTTGRTLLWMGQFRSALLKLFDDVDRISVNINTDCDIVNPGTYRRMIIHSHHVTGDGGQPVVTMHSTSEGSNDGERLLGDFREQGFPFDKYHAPCVFNYYLAGTAYVGTLIFWRDKSAPPISKKTIEEIEGLESFILFALSDHIARLNTHYPFNQAFGDALALLYSEAGMTEQEQKVVRLQLSGHTYDEIAAILHLSKDTVRKHIGSIYRKSDVGSLAELFAKYFTPRHGM